MSNTQTMDRVWPIITNQEALAVSSAWHGHPGTLIRTYPASNSSVQVGVVECDAGAVWKFADGKLHVQAAAGSVDRCLLAGKSGFCPPPTTRHPNVSCGLLLGDCSESTGRWNFTDNTVRWWD